MMDCQQWQLPKIDYENASKQPILNTSIPKNELSKNVITSNATKVQTEVDQAIQLDEPDNYEHYEDESRSTYTVTNVEQRNFLKDAS